jgi:hypothetical protein
MNLVADNNSARASRRFRVPGSEFRGRRSTIKAHLVMENIVSPGFSEPNAVWQQRMRIVLDV